jgi:hypothetical protein
MCPRQRSRRSLLRTAVASSTVGLLGSLAGCGGRSGGGSAEGDESARIDTVPTGADAVLGVDVAALLDDDALREELNRYLARGPGPSSVATVLAGAGNETGLDPGAVRELVAFGTADGSPPTGSVLWTDWSRTDLFEAVESRSEGGTEATYGERTLLTGVGETDAAIGALGDGVFAAGARATVEAVVDCRQGDADPVGGEVRTAYTSAREGHVRFGFDVPVDRIPEDAAGPFDATPLQELTYGYGSLDDDGSLALSLRATGGDAATDVASILESGLALAREELETTSDSTQRERLGPALENTTVGSDGPTVSVRTADEGTALLVALGAVAGTYLLGYGSPSSRRNPPAVAFSVEYDAGTRILRISHDGGEHVPASELYVRGRGVPTGRWDRLGGAASGESDAGPAVTAGDRIALPDVAREYEVRVVWESGNRSAVLLRSGTADE